MATQTVAYYEKLSDGRWTRRKEQIQDDTYGVNGKPVHAPQTLGFIDDSGKLIILGDLLARMKTPVWGPDKDQYFADLIPDFPAKVPETISNEQWQSFPFDPDNPETYPKTECPPDSPIFTEYNGQRGWECNDTRYPGRHWQNVHWMGEESVDEWRILHISYYRRQKDGWDNPRIPNPDFPVVEAQRAAAGEAYSNLIRSTFVPVGAYQFQGLPLNGGYLNKEYQWSIDGVKTPPIPGHKLAVVVTSAVGAPWKMIPAPMRNPEIVTVNTSAGPVIKDLYEQVYALKTQWTTWDATKESKMVYLTK